MTASDPKRTFALAPMNLFVPTYVGNMRIFSSRGESSDSTRRHARDKRCAHPIATVALSIALSISGCSPYYRPLAPKEDGAYDTSVQVDPRTVFAYETKIRPDAFPVILIVADSNMYRAKFEFALRQAFAELGATNVFNVEEFKRFAADRKFAMPASSDPRSNDVVSRFSSDVAPVLLVSASYRHVSEGTVLVTLRIEDGRSNQTLLDVYHRRLVLLDPAEEALFPVLNQLRRWYLDSAARSA